MPIEQVNGEIYYHIQNKNWNVGETYRIGDVENGFPCLSFEKDYKDIHERSSKIRDIINVAPELYSYYVQEILFLNSLLQRISGHSICSEIYNEILEHKNYIKDKRTLFVEKEIPDIQDLMIEYLNLGGLLRNYLLLIREDVFEEVRASLYPDQPSRKKCLWVIANNENLNDAIEFWWEELNRKGQLLKLELTGDVFHANEQYLQLSLKPLVFLKEEARNYWKGKTGDYSKNDEYLFVGKAKVIDIIYKDYDDFIAHRAK
jgi:hypothetical protein